MSATIPLAFDTFGDMLKFLRRRAQLTQKELSIAVGYSEAQISRLEQNQRLPDLATLAALFVPALDADPPVAAKLMELAARARGESITLTRTVTREITETIEEEAPPYFLPLQLTDFIGRAEEVGRAVELLAEARLVTLTGAGGAGKTRLALEAASRVCGDFRGNFRDGAAFIELASLTDAAHLAQAVATVLGLKPNADRPALDRVVHFLRARHLLLVLDNCEHVIEAAAHFADAVLRACPHTRVLATSREALNVAGGAVYRVPPLVAPEAVELFLTRARSADAAFPATEANVALIAQICQRLDGLPLAIELAAARVSVMSLGDFAARLEDALDTLGSGSRTAPARHQTLRATIEWSYQLLDDDERALLRRLAVFAGGFAADAVERVMGNWSLVITNNQLPHFESLFQLVTKSLAVADTTGTVTRYRLLETIRQFAHEKLVEAGEAEATRRAHFNYFAALAAECEPQFKGPDNQTALAQIEADHDNFRAALGWAMQNDPPAGLRLVMSLWHFWRVRGYPERANWLARFLARPGLPERSPLVAKARAYHAAITLPAKEAASQFAASRVICAEAGDRAAYAAVLNAEGNSFWWRDYAHARACFEEGEAIHRVLNDVWGQAYAHVELGELIQTRDDDRPASRRHFEEGVRLFRACGDRQALANTTAHLGDVALEQSDLPTTEACSIEALTLAREFGDKETQAWALNDLGIVAFGRGDFERAIELNTASLRLSREVGSTWHAGLRQYWLGLAYAYAGQLDLAAECFEDTLSLSRADNFEWGIPASLYGLGEVARRQGKLIPAQTYLLDSLAAYQSINYRWGIATVLDGLAALAVAQNQMEHAAQLFGAAEALREAIGVVLLPIERVERDRHLGAAQRASGEGAFAAQYAAGRALPLAEAIEYARHAH
jgi:predicted ATPase/DNA-binding XRE family transcriptional regulator